MDKDSLIITEVKVSLCTRKLCQKATSNNGGSGGSRKIFRRKKRPDRATSGTDNSTDVSSNTRNKTCYYCKKSGHCRSNYPVLKYKSQATILESKQHKSYDLEKDLALVSSVQSTYIFGSCVIDFCSLFHMSPP